jgi:hypothetical protein
VVAWRSRRRPRLRLSARLAAERTRYFRFQVGSRLAHSARSPAFSAPTRTGVPFVRTGVQYERRSRLGRPTVQPAPRPAFLRNRRPLHRNAGLPAARNVPYSDGFQLGGSPAGSAESQSLLASRNYDPSRRMSADGGVTAARPMRSR